MRSAIVIDRLIHAEVYKLLVMVCRVIRVYQVRYNGRLVQACLVR